MAHRYAPKPAVDGVHRLHAGLGTNAIWHIEQGTGHLCGGNQIEQHHSGLLVVMVGLLEPSVPLR